MSLSKTCLARLQGVHPDLVRVIRRAAAETKVPFAVVEGLRTLERQKQLKAAGATKILNSRHITAYFADLGRRFHAIVGTRFTPLRAAVSR